MLYDMFYDKIVRFIWMKQHCSYCWSLDISRYIEFSELQFHYRFDPALKHMTIFSPCFLLTMSCPKEGKAHLLGSYLSENNFLKIAITSNHFYTFSVEKGTYPHEENRGRRPTHYGELKHLVQEFVILVTVH